MVQTPCISPKTRQVPLTTVTVTDVGLPQSQANDHVSTRVDCIFIILFDPTSTGHGLFKILRYIFSEI